MRTFFCLLILLVDMITTNVRAARAQTELSKRMEGSLGLEHIFPSDAATKDDRIAEVIAEELANRLIDKTLELHRKDSAEKGRRRLLYFLHKTKVTKHVFTDFSHPIVDSIGPSFDAITEPNAKCANIMTGWAQCFFK
jgi:hypothetical protein